MRASLMRDMDNQKKLKGLDDLYELKLHETGQVGENVQATRVHGGWIYKVDDDHPVFVPFTEDSKAY